MGGRARRQTCDAYRTRRRNRVLLYQPRRAADCHAAESSRLALSAPAGESGRRFSETHRPGSEGLGSRGKKKEERGKRKEERDNTPHGLVGGGVRGRDKPCG